VLGASIAANLSQNPITAAAGGFSANQISLGQGPSSSSSAVHGDPGNVQPSGEKPPGRRNTRRKRNNRRKNRRNTRRRF
jgi:hypothetical protein